ncbi:3-hydroxybutyryl-CoA dehydrogenase [Marininema halotolerans]|uniref:3-hydroxybutyryl-CoA dehydrogenase n=1 Tax=Marininema halotolerans TaxID=1155944 RepID=A0A1I6R9D6_9BACL|nr:3-hydroxybutyryl-CoA dehydrogenase [Marininema halotolerans]
MRDIQRVAVYGGGTMGQGIAEMLAKKGIDVILIEQTEALVQLTQHQMDLRLNKQLAKWGITQAEKKLILGRITFTATLNELAKVDLVIETVTEDLEAKKEVFKRCDRLCPPYTILTSNTSTLSVTELAAVTKRADRVIGLHFIHSSAQVDLVEIVRGLQTSSETIQHAQDFLKTIDLTFVEVDE